MIWLKCDPLPGWPSFTDSEEKRKVSDMFLERRDKIVRNEFLRLLDTIN
jgi:hypothetical protein